MSNTSSNGLSPKLNENLELSYHDFDNMDELIHQYFHPISQNKSLIK
jgi:hypothetical protein